MLRKWEELPSYMRTEEVRPYYDGLAKKKKSLYLKRIFDVIVASLLLVLLSPLFLIISILITTDSKGGVFFRQERVTQYGRKFRIFKFRTMVADAERKGTQVTVQNDVRITKIGAVLRRNRLDEIPQLIKILLGDMTFVGTRPESTYYVRQYTKEMCATLLLPAGVTSEASIRYKDESELLATAENADEMYVKTVLPGKMKYNLESVRKFSFFNDIKIMIKTTFVIFVRKV